MSRGDVSIIKDHKLFLQINKQPAETYEKISIYYYLQIMPKELST